MSSLGLLVAGLLTVLLWFEVSSAKDFTGSERAAFVLAALTETILFVASILGLVGAAVRKQSFTQTYAYILYGHFILNIGVAAYFLYEVTRVTHNAQRLACKTAIQDVQAQEQCTGLLLIARWVYMVVAGTVLLVEMYGVIIVTRYLNQLQREKGVARAMRQDTESAFGLKVSSRGQYERLPSPALLPPLDPYLRPSVSDYNPYVEDERLAPPVDTGYGGGSWTHDSIASEEKAKMKEHEAVDLASNENHLTEESRTDSDGLAPTLVTRTYTLPVYSPSTL